MLTQPKIGFYSDVRVEFTRRVSDVCSDLPHRGFVNLFPVMFGPQSSDATFSGATFITNPLSIQKFKFISVAGSPTRYEK